MKTGPQTETAQTAQTTATVVVRDLRVEYGDGAARVTALNGVSADFLPGTFTAVMGPSGSGKSTLLHCAAGLERPTRGTVTIDGTQLNGLDENRLTRLRRDRVGFVFQSYNLVSALTAEQNVALPVRLAGRRPAAAAVTSALAAVGLADRARSRPSEMSGGEQQRVAIARALFTRPAVLFADEPTGALDTRTSHQVLNLLRAFVDDHRHTDHQDPGHQDTGHRHPGHRHTVILVTHDPVAAAIADRVLLLADGRLVDELVGASAESVAAATAGLDASC